MKQKLSYLIRVIHFKKVVLLSFLATCTFWVFCLPGVLFKEPTSTVVESREGVLLGARLATDGQWRFPKMDSVPEKFEKALLYFEDEYFYSHPGFNPGSMIKAAWQNLTTDHRRGGSTLTQQVIRLSRKNRKRSYLEKAIELFMATRLEAGSSKKDILTLYASYAPFGGNVVGLETASWRYFGIPAHQLSWGQAAALAVLPNAPALIFPGKNEAVFETKRNRLLDKLLSKGIIDTTTHELAIAEPLPGKPLPLPQLAPHFTDKMQQDHAGQRITSTLSLDLQQQLNNIAIEHYRLLNPNEIHNLAILVLDVNSHNILGYVGNAPTDSNHNNFVDIIDRPRSTGSILKPFLYAMALEEGLVLPRTLLKDVPTVINGYQPTNFDGQFYGAVPTKRALSSSLNIPAVRLLQSYGLHRFHNRLGELNLTHINRPANHYGLSLVLGGAESSLLEITSAYASMASTLNYFSSSSSEYRTQEFGAPNYFNDKNYLFGNVSAENQVLNAGAIYTTFEALRTLNRPETELNWNYFSSSQEVAWKTGTSYGFKDAWAVGVNKDVAIGVWVGNADGEGRPGITGVEAAAPILFDVLNGLPKSAWFETPYDELVAAITCSQSGHLAGLYCDETLEEYVPVNGLRSKACPYHQKVFLSTSEGERVNSSCYELENMVQKNWFVLPPVQEYYYANHHPEYQSLPPFKQDCLRGEQSLMEFIFPKKNETIIMASDFDHSKKEIVFKLAHTQPETTVYWYLDDAFIGSTTTFHELGFEPAPGSYTLTAVDQDGNELKQLLEVTTASL